MNQQALPKIKWIKDADEPYYKSADGRFDIEPLYLGRERPQGWMLRDNTTGATSRSFSCGLRGMKERAQRILAAAAPAPAPAPAPQKRNSLCVAPHGLTNLDMNEDVYAKRRAVIALIHEAKRLVPELPRINVRITDDHATILGCAKMGQNTMWITQSSVASRHVVFHEILHAVFKQPHIKGCPLMGPVRVGKPSDEELNNLFKTYAVLALAGFPRTN